MVCGVGLPVKLSQISWDRGLSTSQNPGRSDVISGRSASFRLQVLQRLQGLCRPNRPFLPELPVLVQHGHPLKKSLRSVTGEGSKPQVILYPMLTPVPTGRFFPQRGI